GPLPSIRAPSIATSPYSLTSTAHRDPGGLRCNRSITAVVLPTPRKPVIRLIGMAIRGHADGCGSRHTLILSAFIPRHRGEGPFRARARARARARFGAALRPEDSASRLSGHFSLAAPAVRRESIP